MSVESARRGLSFPRQVLLSDCVRKLIAHRRSTCNQLFRRLVGNRLIIGTQGHDPPFDFCIAVVAGVCVEFRRVVSRPPSTSADPREANDGREDLSMVTDVGGRRRHGRRCAASIHQNRVFRPGFAAINGARTAAIAAAKCSHLSRINHCRMQFQTVMAFQFREHEMMNPLPQPASCQCFNRVRAVSSEHPISGGTSFHQQPTVSTNQITHSTAACSICGRPP